MKLYLLSMTATVDWGEVRTACSSREDTVRALRDAADELEDYGDWKVPYNDPVSVEVEPTKGGLVSRAMVRNAAYTQLGIRYLTIEDINWTDREYVIVDFPDWALCTLVNGDPLEDAGDRTAYDDWEKSMLKAGYDLLSPDVLDDRNEFCASPGFGPACGTTKVRFFKRKETGMATRLAAKTDMAGWGVVFPEYPLQRGVALVEDKWREYVLARAKASGFVGKPLPGVGHDYHYQGELYRFVKEGT